MKINQIIEAPIEDIRTYGDFSKPGSLRATDMAIVGSQKGQDKIKRVLFQIPVPVILHLINYPKPGPWDLEQMKHHLSFKTPTPRPDRYQTVGLMDPQSVKKRYGVDINYDPQAFNLVFVENEGSARYQLTPWIIAHRMKHAFDLIDTEHYGRTFIPDIKSLGTVSGGPHQSNLAEYEFLRMIGDVTGWYGTADTQKELRNLLTTMLDTKAGREGKLITAGEFFPEAFALLCVRGKIGLMPVPAEVMPAQKWLSGAHAVNRTALQQSEAEQLNSQLPQWEQNLTQAYLALLQWGIGKIVVL